MSALMYEGGYGVCDACGTRVPDAALKRTNLSSLLCVDVDWCYGRCVEVVAGRKDWRASPETEAEVAAALVRSVLPKRGRGRR